MQRIITRKHNGKIGSDIWIKCPWHCQRFGVAENCLGCPLFVSLIVIDKTNLELTCSWNGWDDLKKTVDDYGSLTDWV
jgi:hypothetical protein